MRVDVLCVSLVDVGGGGTTQSCQRLMHVRVRAALESAVCVLELLVEGQAGLAGGAGFGGDKAKAAAARKIERERAINFGTPLA